MNNEWAKIDDKRCMKKKGNMFIIRPIDFVESMPLSCPVCNFLMRNQGDTNKYREFKCCSSCSLYFAEPNSKKWHSGWRPSPTAVNVLVQKKKMQYSYMVNL